MNKNFGNKYKRFNKTKNEIDFKMLRKNDACFIKIKPTIRLSTHSSIHIILNDEEYCWDIYDQSGREAHIIYFKGYKIKPCFYLKSKTASYAVKFDNNKIQINQITENLTMDDYIKKYCSFESQKVSCWANAIYYSKRPDKPPFDNM